MVRISWVKKTRLSIAAVLLIPLLLLIPGCDSNADLDVPQIQFLSRAPLPFPDTICGGVEQEVYHLSGGDTLVLDLLLSDNEALSQFKLDIHTDFDCHGHERLAENISENTQDWSVLTIDDLEGAEVEKSVRVIAPANPTAGAYHFQLQVVDQAGNSDATGYVYSILLQNNLDLEAPVLNVSSPSPGTTISLPRGAVLQATGSLQDNISLGEGGNAAIKLMYIRQESGNRYTAVNEMLPSGTGTVFNYNLEYTLPSTLVPGLYTFELEAWDGVNNPSEEYSWTVDVTP